MSPRVRSNSKIKTTLAKSDATTEGPSGGRERKPSMAELPPQASHTTTPSPSPAVNPPKGEATAGGCQGGVGVSGGGLEVSAACHAKTDVTLTMATLRFLLACCALGHGHLVGKVQVALN